MCVGGGVSCFNVLLIQGGGEGAKGRRGGGAGAQILHRR